MRMASRLESMGQAKYKGLTRTSGKRKVWTGRVNLDFESLKAPFSWKKGRMIFVNSMSDLFHENVPVEFICDVFSVMRDTPQHIYQLLTKRSERLSELSSAIDWPSNVWMGVSVESSDVFSRISHLKSTEAAVKFLSCEPLIGPLDGITLEGMDWVIAGGESGPGARPVSADWVRDIRDACIRERVPFHFKQWGGVIKSKFGRELDGRTWDELPGQVEALY